MFSQKMLLLMVAVLPCHANVASPSGITLNQFRIIYPASAEKGITWSLTNNTNRTYLMQSWIRPMDFSTGLPLAEGDTRKAKAAIPLLVTPPLERVEAGQSLTLRIRLTERTLPQDHESVFYLSVKGIPSVSEKNTQVGGQVVVAVVHNIKLFYRPKGLPESGVVTASSQLRFSQRSDLLVVDNPTPFYISFSRVTVGGKPLPADALRKLVPPKGQQSYPLPRGTSDLVEWQIVDEDSQASPLQHQEL
ncbi:molecular chaperone [Candidatus Erwinia dacicola]|uniref:Gram-negative pili assembly chaperone, C-terminal domain protein n=2 Tax=Candidatus Erwinia dacicola TaxID=252393 RepID=A0A328TQ06_9GAMM|nr:molecular chaperone [Candidatus Erwinia dacicola]RAP72538.1 gram-negative pili assembly chaperone, C-terminal domain protein [Candidatus Erwinia dacicola]